MWTSGSTVAQSFIGLGLAYRQPVSHEADREYSIGFRYLRPVQRDVDYDPNSPLIYATDKTDAKDYYASVEWLSLMSRDGFFSIWIGGGVGGEYFTLKTSSVVTDETGGGADRDLASAKAQMSVLLGRASLRAEWALGSEPKEGEQAAWVVGVGANVLLPVVSKTVWGHGTTNLPTDIVQRNESDAQFEEAVALRRSRFGLDVAFTIGSHF